MKEHKFSIEAAKEIDLVSYLSKIGMEPKKIRGNSYWYFSPFREEKEASFKVNRNLNRYYDFGEGTGGSIIDLGIRLFDCTIPQFLEMLLGDSALTHIPIIERKPVTAEPEGKVEILRVRKLSHIALKNYLGDRRIPLGIAELYCKQVHFSIRDREYFAVGFPCDAGGYELRSSFIKVSSSPKGITHVTNGASAIAVFEGFFDFLSYLVIAGQLKVARTDYLILNSLAFLNGVLELLKTYRKVHLYLDNNPAGRKHTEMAIAENRTKFVDKSSLYRNHEDLNDFLCHVGRGRD